MPNPYNYEWDGEFYVFTTDLGVIYRVYFVGHGDLFKEYPTIDGRVFSFGFFAIYTKPLEKRNDERVRHTLAEIVYKFFETKANVIVFVCDEEDSRPQKQSKSTAKKEKEKVVDNVERNLEECRKKLFTRWFKTLNSNASCILEKHDGIVLGDGEDIKNSLILRADLEDKEYVVKVFAELNQKVSKPAH